MERNATNSGRGVRMVATLVAVLVGLGALLPGLASAAPLCGCQKTGPYVNPTRSAPEKSDLSPDGGEFRLETVDQTAIDVTLHVTKAATGDLVHNFTLPLPRLDWGFSPDGTKLMYRHAFIGAEGASPTIDVIGLYNLKDDTSAWSSQVTAGSDVAFSPHGRWFMVNILVSQNDAQILVIDAKTGASAHSEEIFFQNVPGYPGDRYGTMGMGFSPDDGDRTFVRAYRDTNGQVQLWARNLETRSTVLSTTVTSDSWWKFSPCGDVLGLVTQPDQVSIAVSLRRIEDGTLVGPTQWLPTSDSVRLESTLDHHRVIDVTPNDGEHVINVGPNTADQACTAAPALSQVTVAPTSVVGGEGNATGTVRLTSAATAPFAVSLSSSNSGAATVPATVTIPAGSTSATFTVTSRPVQSAVAVTITAAAGTVSKAATLTVNPTADAPLESVSVDPARVLGGQPTTATVTLASAAGPSGSVVSLSSSKPGVASVPATVTVPAGQLSATFAIATTAVRVDTPATITAVGGGITRSTRMYALTGNRECTAGTTAATNPGEPLKARGFASFDDAGANADCAQNMTYTGSITVGAGSTGLPVGAPVTLEFRARFDGTNMTSPPISSGGTLAEGRSSYSIVDRTASTGSDGLVQVVDFRAFYNLQHYALGVNLTKQSSVDLITNVGEPVSVGTYEDATTADAVVWDVDTGELTATYTTTVGAHLSLRARSSAVASAYGSGATAIADFDQTFVATTAPAAGFEGLELAYDDPDAPTGVHGVVTTTDGQPLSGVAVMAYAETDTWLPTGTATTAADGSYEITDLPDGRYRIRFGGGADRVSEWFDDSSTRAAATVVSVVDGYGIGGVDASLAPAASVSGVVTGADGQPLDGVTVMAFADTDTWFPSAAATTAADGSYRLTGLAAGSYRLLLTGPNTVSEWYEDSPSRSAATPVTVAAGDAVGGVDASLAPAASVSGVVTGAEGQPLEGVTVMAYAETDTWLPSATATTAADGSYQLTGLAGGTYRMRFNGSGTSVSEWYDDSPTRAAATPVSVAGGAAVGGVDASLASAATISGTVTGPEGLPLEGVKVMAFAETDTWFPSATATTAEDGSYQLMGLPAGAYRLLFTGPGIVTEWYEDSSTRAAASAVTVAGGAVAEVAVAVLAFE